METGILYVIFLFFVTMAFIALYLRSSFRLFKRIKEEVPDVWEDLGRPEIVDVSVPFESFVTIKPLIPWLIWVLKGDTAGLPEDVALCLLRTRRLLFLSLGFFTATVLLFFIFYSQAQ